MSVSERQYLQAEQAGETARQSGKKRDQSPLYAMGEDGELLREAWRNGWDAENERRAKR